MTTSRYSIVVVCKGRLRHLRASLPRFLAQRGFEVVVVDYACPDGTAVEVSRNYPSVRIVEIDRVDFNMSIGRNAGAGVATGDWLVFLDADVIVADDFADRLERATEEGSFYRFGTWEPGREGIFGSFVARKRDFNAISGFDEIMQGYGGADADLYFRLDRLKLRGVFLDAAYIKEMLPHTEAERTQFYARKSTGESQLVNCTYRQLKNMLLREMTVPELPLDLRRELYNAVNQRVSRALENQETTVGFTVPLLDDPSIMPFPDWMFLRRIEVDLIARKGDVQHQSQ